MEAGTAAQGMQYRPCIEVDFLMSHCESIESRTIGTTVFVSKTQLGWIIPKGLEPETGEGGRRNKVEMKWKSLMLGK